MKAHLAILLCTYNGEDFLPQQLDSYSRQTFQNWHLFAYDDGSTDRTKTLIENYSKKNNGKVTFISNRERMGFCGNFLNAIKSVPDGFEFYALSDQDDVWLEAKLARAVEYLNSGNSEVPALYCSRTTLTDHAENETGFSPLFSRPVSFGNALVQSIAGGNTMVFNQSARSLIATLKPQTDVVSHDWFIYQLITGAGGKVYYDSHSEILYRQHNNNLIGSNNSFSARLSRAKMLLKGSFRSWNSKNIKALQENFALLTPKNKNMLDNFANARESALIPRVTGLMKCGVYRQTFLGNIALVIGGILNKI